MTMNLQQGRAKESSEDFRTRAEPVVRGNYFEDFEVGQQFDHHWGRTIHHSENVLFTTLTLSFNPIYFNIESARDAGRRDIVVNPLFAFNTVFGLSVEDLSELGGAFLGVDDLVFHRDLFVGDTLTARSEVVAKKVSRKHSDLGIVTWRTTGSTPDGEVVLDFARTNLVQRAPRGASDEQ